LCATEAKKLYSMRTCRFCQAQIEGGWSDLQKHIRSDACSSKKPRSRACSFCGLECATWQVLQAHIRGPECRRPSPKVTYCPPLTRKRATCSSLFGLGMLRPDTLRNLIEPVLTCVCGSAVAIVAALWLRSASEELSEPGKSDEDPKVSALAALFNLLGVGWTLRRAGSATPLLLQISAYVMAGHSLMMMALAAVAAMARANNRRLCFRLENMLHLSTPEALVMALVAHCCRKDPDLGARLGHLQSTLFGLLRYSLIHGRAKVLTDNLSQGSDDLFLHYQPGKIVEAVQSHSCATIYGELTPRRPNPSPRRRVARSNFRTVASRQATSVPI
jgi:hypothetical protein